MGYSVVQQLVSDSTPNGDLALRRSNTAESDDAFRVPTFPVLAINPDTSKADHLYVAFPDKGSGSDRADVFLTYSTDGGVTWNNRVRLSTVASNDQWMPVLAVKPDGLQLFVGWYDRRNDTNNSLMEVYGRWGEIASNGTVTLGDEFRISTESFPMVFAGTRGLYDPIYNLPGQYDPVYPPRDVNLHWWYSEWPDSIDFLTVPSYEPHVGEYNHAYTDGQRVFFGWTDYRRKLGRTSTIRNSPDIRFLRTNWPQ